MPTVTTHLRQRQQPAPSWLRDFTIGAPFDHRAFFGSRVVYYPSWNSDLNAIGPIISSHAVHCFALVDDTLTEASTRHTIAPESPHCLTGYDIFELRHLPRQALPRPAGEPHLDPNEQRALQTPERAAPFGLLAVFTRAKTHDSEHGPDRIAIVFLAADPFISYDILFTLRENSQSAFGVLIQDRHAAAPEDPDPLIDTLPGDFDPAWISPDHYGAGGLMELISRRAASWPEWLFASSGTEPWNGYQLVPDIHAHNGRQLFERP